MSDELLIYPTNKVVGVADDRAEVAAAARALAEVDVPRSRVELLCGQDDAEATEPDPSEQGPLGAVVRVVQHALGEETPRLATLSDALAAGRWVVQVELSEDDEQRDREKHAVGAALKGAGLSEVAYYGPNAIEELQLGA